ncbi:hypothetical protein AB0A74_09145 [Saccharothrix sp. NPDC042600]|uniref:hypothetical protein n=1 Tax=Saccharothrix TaxID=2071 RepID=UPI0033CE7D40|nr:hypothetical protein GCM10017745_13400 [Saccharothrix mutabilis subsp. capreolus]
MDIGEPERSGRHRLEDGAAPWLPLGGELDHAPAPRSDRPPGTTPTPHARPTERPPGTTATGHLPPTTTAADRARPGTAAPPPSTTAGQVRPGTAAAPSVTAAPPPPGATAGGRPPGSAAASAPTAAPASVSTAAAPAPTPQAAIPAQRDPHPDRESIGLGSFNIGLVPASVTPPRTWKRAAWFAVLSSAGVLAGLVYAAIKLVGAGTPTDRLGMPGYPTSAPIVTGFGTSTPSPTPTARPQPGARPEAPAAPERTPEVPATAVGGTSAAPASSAPSASPTVTTVPSSGAPVVDAVAVAARTESFYEQAVANAATALEMVADTFEADAKALLKGHFKDVSAIEVTEISVDPARGVTISTLHVKNRDGSTTTEKRQLGFTTSGDPLINAERLFGGV